MESRRWRVHVESYHYLGWRVPFGANLRYWVRNRDSGTDVSALDIAGLENARARCLDWMEQRAAETPPCNGSSITDGF